ncbi:MAG: hypothetical protein PUC21_10170 [Bacteroidales bacterium]|nr:hypothetical protein [Bacteroidales bacterium]
MSSIKTTKIDGDLSVGRNVAIGGKVTVQGSSQIKGSLKVDGWLDAKNIKGANKGIFTTVEKLREAYPMPHDGWWAIVGITLPGPIYVGDGGEWVATGEEGGNPTVDSEQYNEAVAELQGDIALIQGDIKEIEEKDKLQDTLIASQANSITTQGELLSSHSSSLASHGATLTTHEEGLMAQGERIEAIQAQLDTVDSVSGEAKSQVDVLERAYNEFSGSKGVAGGLAPLDSDSKIPEANLPDWVDDVLEIGEIVKSISAAKGISVRRSDEANCSVSYSSTTNKFYLKVVDTITEVDTGIASTVAFYYGDWADSYKYGTQETGLESIAGTIPHKGKLYVDTSTNTVYRYDGTSLVAVGSGLKLGHEAENAFPGNEGAELQASVELNTAAIQQNANRIGIVGILKADGEWNGVGAEPAQGVWLCPNGEGGVYWRTFGETDFYNFAEEEYNSDVYANEDRIYRVGSELYRIENNKLAGLSGSAVGNCFNVTNEVPITGSTTAYYNLQSAIEATWEKGLNKIGMQISFAISDKIWKTYQYIGSTTKQSDFLDIDNWQDFGSLAAGSETYIVIDNLCGAPLAGDYYTLETAVSRLIEYQERAGVTYAKKGLIISYRTGENEMETKQFQGEVSGFGEVGLWKDFGGGGSEVITADTPEQGGTDALSTGGAYTHLPAGLNIDTETEGVVKLKLVNAEGSDIGDEVQFSVGTGSGGYTGTTIAVAFQANPFYGKANGDFKLKAAIMSVTKVGSQETTNTIASVTFINRTTKNSVATFKPRQGSSATLTDYSFEFDLSGVCAAAGEYPLQAVITDDGGNTATKNISILSIDVTCESVQTLNYTKETSLQVGGPKTSIPMFRFPNNASDKGISTKVEMYKNGEWVVLQETVVNDTYPHNVSIDPSGLGHGAYPIRIQGTDVASGTKGNVLHSAVMVIEQRESVADYNKPIVVARWSDNSERKMKLFETITFDIACYQRDNLSPTVTVVAANRTTGTTETLTSREMSRTKYYSLEKRLVGYSDGDVLEFNAVCGGIRLVEAIGTTIEGSLLAIAETEGAYYKISLEGRSNSDTDKTIKTTATDGTEIRIDVTGANYSSNGFVADNFGTEQAEGRMALRIAENVEAVCTDKPFASPYIVQNGLALSITCKIKNIAKRDAIIMSCMSERLGFVMTGEKFIVTTDGDSEEALKSVFTTAATSYLDDVEYRFDIVIEPKSRAPYSGIMLCKVYQNGDMSACVPIDVSSSFPNFTDNIHFYGNDADCYLFEIVRWNTYYDFQQALNNYIINIKDSQAMLKEYEQNQVMSDVTAEGVIKARPDMQKLLDRGIMVCAMTRTSDKNLSSDGTAVTDSNIYYPDYIEPLKDKKTAVYMDWYLYFPDRPWADCKVEAVPVTNQGTSTLAYAVKNKKAKFKKSKGIKLLHTREEISAMYNGDESILAKYDDAASLAKSKKIRVKEGSLAVNTITIKVDYSDSAGANNTALMEQMNDVQLAIGDGYITPAQKFNTNSAEVLHTSIDGVTCALFRTDYRIGQEKGAEEATRPENAYFHSKANFNVDKGNPHFFGFEDVAGYNKGCVNYGDFTELVAPRGTDIDSYKATVLAGSASLIPGTLYMISEFCGPQTRFIENDGTGSMSETSEVSDYEMSDKAGAEIAADDVNNYDWDKVYRSADGKYYKYTGGVWRDTTGSMTYDATTKKWSIVGRVLNPVECYEYRQYQEFCWQQGVNTVDDMLETMHTDDGDVPVWTTYYESRYPDDDDLNDLYTQGKKVPYQLFRELQFCQQCNQNLTDNAEENAALNADGSEKVFNGAGASTTITLGDVEVPGTKENRLLKWQREMHKIFSPHSTNCYVVASDYKATVDQRAKNMMVAMYKEIDGNIRCYFNHWYDGDSVDGADNDCYLTIPWDMDGAESHLYQGYDGVMFRQTYELFAKGEGVWIDDGGTMLTLHDTAAAMRSAKTSSGQEIFSADGCYRYWMSERILKWPKVVSSFDGQRKYIETATAADNHYPALHGLRLDSLASFQRKRFGYRDGYYQTGDLFKKFFQARMMGPITIKITAAQDGYFGMGVDSTSSAKYSCYLKAGESYTFTEVAAGTGGKLIYIFGADKLSELDLSGCTPKSSNWMIADCTLLRKLIVGGENYEPAYTDDILSALNLGLMPFLEEVDIRNTKILNANASGCPRLRKVFAEGSLLKTITLAESSPISILHLPATMTELSFSHLPSLGYPNGGLTFEGLANVTRFSFSNCPKIDVQKLLTDIIDGGSKIAEIKVENVNISGSSHILDEMKANGTKGIGSDNTAICDGISGRYILSNLLEETDFAALQAYFPQLVIYNAQYSQIVFNDEAEDTENITNMDNKTGYLYGNTYVKSGHFVRIEAGSHAYRAIYDSGIGAMRCKQLSDSNYNYYADGTEIDLNDISGEGFDIMKRLQPYWYKGVNDYKNQQKHFFVSSQEGEPISTATKVNRSKLSDILLQDFTSVFLSANSVGNDLVISENANHNTYSIDVEGMKQVRFPGVNSSAVGAAFVDADGKVVGLFNMYVTHSQFDFTPGEYIFCDVPQGAKRFVFSSQTGIDDVEAIAVDSSAIEAIEPDWVHTKERLVGVYGASIDGLNRLRSISGAKTRCGTNTSVTSSNWTYDETGNVTNATVPTDLNYTMKDFQNLAMMRKNGYQLIDYEMSKDIANLVMALTGTRDIQSYAGYGCSVGYTTGANSLNTFGNQTRNYVGSSIGNVIFGLQNFVGGNYEWTDNTAINVLSFASFKKNRGTQATVDVVDRYWHIYDPVTKTERKVQQCAAQGDWYCICRVKFGRYCDYVPSRMSNDNSAYNKWYADGHVYGAATARVVGRGGYSAGTYAGLVCSYAFYASSSSHTNFGSRLAFIGKIEIE